MTIVGFSFTKIAAERKGAPSGKVNVSNNVGIKSVEKTPLQLGTKGTSDALKFLFQFKADYAKLGSIELEGEVLYLTEEKQVDAIMNEWKKTKKLSQELMTLLLNNVLAKSNIEALLLSKEINLPPPIPLPRVTAGAPPAAAKKK